MPPHPLRAVKAAGQHASRAWVGSSTSVRTASNMPPVTGSRMGIPDGPGLGIDVVPGLLGAPFFEVGR